MLKSSSFWLGRAGATLAIVLSLALPAPARGQSVPVGEPLIPVTKPRAQATRSELEASLTEIDKILGSSGYSARLRNAKRREAELVRQRLAEGDFRVGDAIILAVSGEPSLSGNFSVAPGRVLVLPGVKDIPLAGVLRSESQAYLAAQIAKYVRDPQVQAQAMIRLSVFGEVGKTGYFQMPADVLASDAIMLAGGPKTDQAPNRTVIKRAGREIVSRDVFQGAVQNGLTLDQLNLQAGDEIYVGGKGKPVSVLQVLGAAGGVATSIYFISRIFSVRGIF